MEHNEFQNWRINRGKYSLFFYGDLKGNPREVGDKGVIFCADEDKEMKYA